jgi:hypothetical protein
MHSNFEFHRKKWPKFVKNGQTRTGSIRPPFLAELPPKITEIFPNLPNFTRIGAQQTSNGLNFVRIGRNSSEIGGENEIISIRPF